MNVRSLRQNNLSIAGRAHSGQLFDTVHRSGFAEGAFWQELKIQLAFFNQNFAYRRMVLIPIFGGRYCNKTDFKGGY